MGCLKFRPKKPEKKWFLGHNSNTWVDIKLQCQEFKYTLKGSLDEGKKVLKNLKIFCFSSILCIILGLYMEAKNTQCVLFYLKSKAISKKYNMLAFKNSCQINGTLEHIFTISNSKFSPEIMLICKFWKCVQEYHYFDNCFWKLRCCYFHK